MQQGNQCKSVLSLQGYDWPALLSADFDFQQRFEMRIMAMHYVQIDT